MEVDTHADTKTEFLNSGPLTIVGKQPGSDQNGISPTKENISPVPTFALYMWLKLYAGNAMQLPIKL
jgi:hypothetical protein